MYEKILVGYDDPPSSRKALQRALELVKRGKGEVHLHSAEERLPIYAATVGEVQ